MSQLFEKTTFDKSNSQQIILRDPHFESFVWPKNERITFKFIEEEINETKVHDCLTRQ